MESRAALAGNSVFHNKKNLLLIGYTLHSLSHFGVGGIFLTNILLTIRGKRYENQINYFP